MYSLTAVKKGAVFHNCSFKKLVPKDSETFYSSLIKGIPLN